MVPIRDHTCISHVSCTGRQILYHWATWEAPKKYSKNHVERTEKPAYWGSHWGRKLIGKSLTKRQNSLQSCKVCSSITYWLQREKNNNFTVQFSSVQSLSRVWLFATPWIEARQASLSITNSQSSLKLMPIESVMPSSHLILCCPLLLLPPIPPSIRVSSNESTPHMRWPSTGVSASTSVLPMNTQDLSPSGRTGWISLQSKGLSRIFSNTTVQKHQSRDSLRQPYQV